MHTVKRKMQIYHSRLHLFVTLLVVAAPFLFLLFFAHFAHINTELLFTDVFVSFARLLIAYCIAVVLALVLALVFWKGKPALIALPIFDVLQSFPTFALLPLATLVWGASNTTVIFFLVITIIWPMLFSTISSLKLARNDWDDVASITGLSGLLYVRYFLFPISIPGLITGSIIGLGEGWEALVATEIIAHSPTGLGNFFDSFKYDPQITTLGILGLLILIFSINKLLWLPLLEWSHERMEE